MSLALDVKNGTETLDDLNALLPSLHVVVVKFFREGYCCRRIIKLAWFDFVHGRWQYWSLFFPLVPDVQNATEMFCCSHYMSLW